MLPDSGTCADDGCAKQDKSGGLAVNHQTVELVVWFSLAGLGLIWANVSLWHARRLLNRLRQGVHDPEGRLVSTPVADQTSATRAA